MASKMSKMVKKQEQHDEAAPVANNLYKIVGEMKFNATPVEIAKAVFYSLDKAYGEYGRCKSHLEAASHKVEEAKMAVMEMLRKEQSHLEKIQGGADLLLDAAKGKEQQKRHYKKMDKTDYEILTVLLENARVKNLEIARKLGVTEMVVRYRIKRMKEKGIILGFRPSLDIEKLDFEW